MMILGMLLPLNDSEGTMFRYCLAVLAAGLLAQPGSAHYNMLLPETAMAKKGDKVAFLYQFGHPFEHELFDAPPPDKVEVRLPDGTMVDLTMKLEKFKKPGGVGGKEVTAYRFDFKPEQRGDYWFVLHTPPIWMEEGKEFYQDVVKVLLHVETQNGWETEITKKIRIRPLTRPYGLLPGMLFRAEVPHLVSGTIKLQRIVEVERYNPIKPKEIPPDEFVTFTTRTCKEGGDFAFVFPDAGWWCMTAQRDNGELARAGKDYPVRQRATLWVYVSPKASGK